MRRFRVLVTAAACGVTMTVTAHVVDLAGTWLPDFQQRRYTELISGWYVRADAGYRMQTIGSVDAPAANAVMGFSLENALTDPQQRLHSQC